MGATNKGLLGDEKKMFDVIADGCIIARAENAEEETIYILNCKGMGNEDIAHLLDIPLESVTRLTEGGSTR